MNSNTEMMSTPRKGEVLHGYTVDGGLYMFVCSRGDA